MERGFHALGALRNQVLARDLAGPAPMIEESRTGAVVRELCASHPAIPSFAVVEAGAKSSASSNANDSFSSSRNRSGWTSITGVRSGLW
jgi:hypothetical protein